MGNLPPLAEVCGECGAVLGLRRVEIHHASGACDRHRRAAGMVSGEEASAGAPDVGGRCRTGPSEFASLGELIGVEDHVPHPLVEVGEAFVLCLTLVPAGVDLLQDYGQFEIAE